MCCVGACCTLCVVSGLLTVVYYLLKMGRCINVVRCVLFVVSCVLVVVFVVLCCLSIVACRVLCVLCCLLFAV